MKCPIGFMGLSLPEHGYHAPNENYDWGQAGGDIMAFAKFSRRSPATSLGTAVFARTDEDGQMALAISAAVIGTARGPAAER